MDRSYAGADPIEVLKEVYYEGKSEGWFGSLSDEREFMRKLNPYNVIRINAETGTWVLKRNHSNRDRKDSRRNDRGDYRTERFDDRERHSDYRDYNR